ncbi:MAG TPA: MotA/TolQ/ExbB proton channel family protein [Chlamydiales bacterium]
MTFIASNPFISAYAQSDWFGKGIFWGLFLLSALCWIVIVYKGWQFRTVRKLSEEFSGAFVEKKMDPLELQCSRPTARHLKDLPHPLFDIYRGVKQQALQLIGRNGESLLSTEDLELIGSEAMMNLSSSTKKMEKHLFLLPTIVTLGPFLGLLGTVWGILLTFSQFQGKVNNAAMLSGLSLALATTVVGLLVAIPAVVGYSYLRNAGKEMRRQMEEFSHALMAAIELHYRKG